jgi:hypothetical protein
LPAAKTERALPWVDNRRHVAMVLCNQCQHLVKVDTLTVRQEHSGERGAHNMHVVMVGDIVHDCDTARASAEAAERAELADLNRRRVA